MTGHKDTPWPHRDAELRKLRAEGHGLAEIAKRMGLTKSSVNGRRKRLLLPGWGSPLPVPKPDAKPAVALPPEVQARKDAGLAPLAEGHPIAVAVLREAGLPW